MSQAAGLTPDESQQAIYNALRGNGLTDTISKIITGQSGHETAGWTSNVYLTDNNAFGYGYDGQGNYYAYPSIEDSVTDLINWLDKKVSAGNFPALDSITDPATYAAALKANGYYGDSVSNYTSGITRWIDNNLQITAGIGIAGAMAIGLILFFVFKK